MSVFTTLMIAILLASLTACLFVSSRIVAYNRKYHFNEITYTRLFRIFTKEHFAIIYAVFILMHSVFTTWFLLTL